MRLPGSHLPGHRLRSLQRPSPMPLRTAAASLLVLLLIPAVWTGRAFSSSLDTRIDDLIAQLGTHGAYSTSGRSNRRYLQLAHELLGLYWREVASDGAKGLPPAKLIPAGARFTGCGRRRAANAYCRESGEIVIDPRQLARARNVSGAARERLIGLTVLAHEWGHHLDHHGNPRSTPDPYRNNQENAADWRAGRFLGWLMARGALTVEEYTEAANLLFRIGDFHQASPHGYPLERYRAFTAGVGREILTTGVVGPWHVDTVETFSRRVGGTTLSDGGDLRFAVYRFEVERGGQVAGNLLAAASGALNCFFGSAGSCARSITRQGTAMPDGWFRLRTLNLNCGSGSFDIEGDGLGRQPVANDRKGQAQQLAQRVCSQGSAASSASDVTSSPPGG